MASTMVIITAAVMLLINEIAAKRLVVGGEGGQWSVQSSPNFYNSWAAKQNFVVGDILDFKFSTGSHTVAILTSKTAYDNCDASSAEIIVRGPYSRT